MRIDVLSIFPDFFTAPFGMSIVGRARAEKIVEIHVHDIRKFTRDRHRSVDDRPYGGGPGMVLRPEPIFEGVESIKKEVGNSYPGSRIILMTPQGDIFSQGKAKEFAVEKHLTFICGRYEGVDERIRESLVTDEISIGEYVISGGELAAMVVIEAIVRLLPGALGDENSLLEDSFSFALLEYPQYTRPSDYKGMKVPSVLLRGNHDAVKRWRRREALRRTLRKRPDMFSKMELSEEDKKLLKEM